MAKLGTVISMIDSPNTGKFAFVIGDDAIGRVRKGQFIEVGHEGGKLIAVVKDIFRSNRYFERAESVAEYERSGMLSSHFPVGEWSYTIAETGILGVFDGSQLRRCSFPPSPGSDVAAADDELLSKYLGFREDGLNIGRLMNHEVDVKVGLSRLFQKHVAILAMSGAGKSHLAGVLLEELVERDAGKGRIGVVVIDVHGEYSHMRTSPSLSRCITVYDASKLRIGTRNISPDMFPFYSAMSPPQKRMFSGAFSELKRNAKLSHTPFTVRDIMQALLGVDEKKKVDTRDAVIEHLESAQRMRIFGRHDDPSLASLVKPGHISIIDMKNIDSEKKKQLIVSYYARHLFSAVKKKRIPPFAFIVEEAHNFAGEKVKREDMLSKYDIEKIAREGRKFGASLCLISQRPVRLSTTALAQCNTHIILRVTNPYDVDHIGKSCEGIDRHMLNSITSLKTGEALIVGEAVVQPIFVRVRRHRHEYTKPEADLESLAKGFELAQEKKREDAEAFI